MTPDLSRIAKLRARGLLEPGPTGLECVRISVQQRAELDTSSRAAARAQLESWCSGLSEIIAGLGGVIIPQSLRITAQTVEALVPVSALRRTSEALQQAGARVDLVEPRDAT